MATQKQKDNLFWGLRQKYLLRSETEIVAYDILSDINAERKYERLNMHEMAELFARAVEATDGDATLEYLLEENNGNLLPLFV